MNHPRFVFLAGPGAARILGMAVTEGLAWALIAANNRTLGTGCCICETYAACRKAAYELQRDFEETEARVRTDAAGRFGWELELAGSVVAKSSRSYLRPRECSYNLDRFRAAVPSAVFTDGVRFVRTDLK